MNTVRFIMAFFFFALPAIHNGALGEEVVYVVNGYTHSIPQPNWSTVMMLRGSDLEILQTVTLPAPDAHSIAVTPDGTQLWVTCPNGHHLFVIDAQTFEIIDEFDYSDTINKPMGIAISRDRGEVLVGMHQDDLVVRFDAETRKPLVPPLEAGAEGSFIIFTPDGGRFCLVDQGMSVVKLFRSADRALLRTWNLASPVGLGDAAMSPDGRYLYVANMGLHRIDRLGLRVPWTVNNYPTEGFLRPRGIDISPDGVYLFIGHYMGMDSKVTMWHLEPFWARVGSANIPANGRRVVRNKECTRIYVTEHAEDECHAYRVNCDEESIFHNATADLNTIGGYKASPIGIAVGDYTPLIDLAADKAVYRTTGSISVTANVSPLRVPCYPFVRVRMADGSTLYYQQGVGFTVSPVPYLGFAAGTIMTTEPIMGYPALSANFSGIPMGTYILEGGAVDMRRTTSASNLIYFGGVDREKLDVR